MIVYVCVQYDAIRINLIINISWTCQHWMCACCIPFYFCGVTDTRKLVIQNGWRGSAFTSLTSAYAGGVLGCLLGTERAWMDRSTAWSFNLGNHQRLDWLHPDFMISIPKPQSKKKHKFPSLSPNLNIHQPISMPAFFLSLPRWTHGSASVRIPRCDSSHASLRP